MGVRWMPGGINYGARERVIDVEAEDVTTDPDEGRRQIEAMQPPKLKVGDKVRLSAGGERVMTIVELLDYDNRALCEWPADQKDAKLFDGRRDTFPVRALVLVEASAVEAN